MWLFQNKPREMKKLAAKIAEAGRIYDTPLVVPNGTSYLVKDGNRRITCLKLILEPSKAPEKYRNFFSGLNKSFSEHISNLVFCQIETDLKIADEIISLRHNGTQGGEGQLMWGPREKANHANRTAGKSDYEWSQLVERFLQDNGRANEAAVIKRSTLDRVIGAKKRRQRLGIGQSKDGNIVSSVSSHDLLPLFVKLAEDMTDGKLTLKETLISKDVDKYLDKLQTLGLLPKSSTPSTSSPKPKPGPTPKIPKPKKNVRTTLIPSYVNYEFQWIDGQTKIEMAWSQLQFELELANHKFSISVVYRTLLEMVAKSFIDKNQLTSGNSLRKNLKIVLVELGKQARIGQKETADILRVLEDQNSSISIENLQRIVHSKSHVPSEDDLTTMWDCLDPFLSEAIKSTQ